MHHLRPRALPIAARHALRQAASSDDWAGPESAPANCRAVKTASTKAATSVETTAVEAVEAVEAADAAEAAMETAEAAMAAPATTWGASSPSAAVANNAIMTLRNMTNPLSSKKMAPGDEEIKEHDAVALRSLFLPPPHCSQR